MNVMFEACTDVLTYIYVPSFITYLIKYAIRILFYLVQVDEEIILVWLWAIFGTIQSFLNIVLKKNHGTEKEENIFLRNTVLHESLARCSEE
jgi:hypothetical protein